MKNCTYCGRESDDSAVHCGECGTPFNSEPRRLQSDSMQAAERQMISGALLCIGGIVVTVVSFVSAMNGSFGGIYVITWGAIIFGGERFFRGFIQQLFGGNRSKTATKPTPSIVPDVEGD